MLLVQPMRVFLPNLKLISFIFPLPATKIFLHFNSLWEISFGDNTAGHILNMLKGPMGFLLRQVPNSTILCNNSPPIQCSTTIYMILSIVCKNVELWGQFRVFIISISDLMRVIFLPFDTILTANIVCVRGWLVSFSTPNDAWPRIFKILLMFT